MLTSMGNNAHASDLLRRIYVCVEIQRTTYKLLLFTTYYPNYYIAYVEPDNLLVKKDPERGILCGKP